MTTQEAYDARINEKINALADHPKYSWLRKHTDCALAWRAACGYRTNRAVDFLNRIDAAPLSFLLDWLDGKNYLEWDKIKEVAA